MLEKYPKPLRWPYYAFGFFIVIVIVIIFWFCCFCPMTTVMVIRHADKGVGSDPPLTTAGETRAETLIHVAGESDITALYSTNTIRTMQTATPLADHLGLSVTEYGSTAMEEFVDQVLSDHRGETVLIVGHGDTVPIIVNELCGEEIDEIGGTEYDNLYVVTVCYFGRGKLLHLKYGEPSL